MQKLIDKLLLFGLCLLVLSLTDVRWISVVVMLSAVAVSALSSYFENRLPVILSLLYVAVCIIFPEFTVFLPLIVYDLSGMGMWALRLSWCAALPSGVIAGGWQVAAAAAVVSAAASLLQRRTLANLQMQQKFHALTDDAKEKAAFLEDRNRELMQRQDYEVRLATLAERNRIAREIHDNVGHLLTRAILQVSAMLAADGKRHGGGQEEAQGAERTDNSADGSLRSVKHTLSDAMDSIRSSVHDLHDDSIDLRLQLESVINAFSFCPVKLLYNAGELPAELRVCFTAVVRESLSNIARHSKATAATVAVTEHPAFCQLVIRDNGAPKTGKRSKGIGLQNMEDRVNALGGVFRTEDGNGFKVFVSVPVAL